MGKKDSFKSFMRKVDADITEEDRKKRTSIRAVNPTEFGSVTQTDSDKFWLHATPDQKAQVRANQVEANKLTAKWALDNQHRKDMPPTMRSIGARKKGGAGTFAA